MSEPATRIRMTKTVRGSPDGIRSHIYEEGETYDATTTPPCTPYLAGVLIAAGEAEAAPERKVTTPDPEKKVVNADPEKKTTRRRSSRAKKAGDK